MFCSFPELKVCKKWKSPKLHGHFQKCLEFPKNHRQFQESLNCLSISGNGKKCLIPSIPCDRSLWNESHQIFFVFPKPQQNKISLNPYILQWVHLKINKILWNLHATSFVNYITQFLNLYNIFITMAQTPWPTSLCHDIIWTTSNGKPTNLVHFFIRCCHLISKGPQAL